MIKFEKSSFYANKDLISDVGFFSNIQNKMCLVLPDFAKICELNMASS
jgi:hypothetical protein